MIGDFFALEEKVGSAARRTPPKQAHGVWLAQRVKQVLLVWVEGKEVGRADHRHMVRGEGQPRSGY